MTQEYNQGEYATLRELNVKPEDVVKSTVGYEMKVKEVKKSRVIGDESIGWSMNNPMWRIVSRASDAPSKEMSDMKFDTNRAVQPNHYFADKVFPSKEIDTPKLLRDMTDAEIGALVRADNDGKVIEIWVHDEWSEVNPQWKPGNAYRVRPEAQCPKRETVTLHGSVTDELWGRDQTGYDTYRITFDLIDGKLPTGAYINGDGHVITVEEL